MEKKNYIFVHFELSSDRLPKKFHPPPPLSPQSEHLKKKSSRKNGSCAIYSAICTMLGSPRFHIMGCDDFLNRGRHVLSSNFVFRDHTLWDLLQPFTGGIPPTSPLSPYLGFGKNILPKARVGCHLQCDLHYVGFSLFRHH